MVSRYLDGIVVCPPCANGDHSHHSGYDCKNEILTHPLDRNPSQCLCINDAGNYPKHDESTYLIK